MAKSEKKFTLEQAKEQLIKEQQAIELDRQNRINKFLELLKEAEKETNCALEVDINSSLNNLKIIAISKI